MTDAEYRQLPRYANSDLIELSKRELTFYAPSQIDPKTALFGTFFHAMILEPDKELDWSLIHVKERYKLMQMKDSLFDVRQVPLMLQQAILEGQPEVVKLWDCPVTGLPLKAKLDCVYSPSYAPLAIPSIIDLKTTSCRNPHDFFENIDKYGYDRQAAYYLDALGIKDNYNFYFVCVQKCKPFDVFCIYMGLNDDRKKIVDYGRKKNNFWLKKADDEAKKPNGWKPSSWSRKEGVAV